MKIYFEDDKLSANIINNINPKCMVIDAANGVSYCKRCLDFAMINPQTTMVYTNSILALNNKYVWNDNLNAPELFVNVNLDYVVNFYKIHNCTHYDLDNGWERIDKLTDRQLKESHNLMKLYLAGEFNKE